MFWLVIQGRGKDTVVSWDLHWTLLRVNLDERLGDRIFISRLRNKTSEAQVRGGYEILPRDTMHCIAFIFERKGFLVLLNEIKINLTLVIYKSLKVAL